jgi:MerR family copper efflux transcriptional regulator
MAEHPAHTIGKLASLAGVGIDTVRSYERSGLLEPAARSPSGYRHYGDDELRQLRFIRRAQRLGFTLSEIQELLAVSRKSGVRAVRAAARDKLVDVQMRIAELTRVRDALAGLVEACPGHGAVARCPILRALDGEEA